MSDIVKAGILVLGGVVTAFGIGAIVSELGLLNSQPTRRTNPEATSREFEEATNQVNTSAAYRATCNFCINPLTEPPYCKNMCCICMESLCKKQQFALECAHVFHSDCINEAIRKNASDCPECRKPISPNFLSRVRSSR